MFFSGLARVVPSGAGAGSSLTTEPPHDYLDPITHELMKDPVCTEDGHTYDRASILQWWRQCHGGS